MWKWLFASLVVSQYANTFTSAAFEKFKGSVGCPPMQFLCMDGECISEEKHCNGHPDCIDGTDEHNCDVIRCLAPMYFECDNNRCVSSSFVCDDDNDCEDWSDEKNCSDHSAGERVVSTCSPREFQCLDRLCIPQNWVCDGKADCLDSSDETLGCSKNITCDGFKCKNHFCIPQEFYCDGGNDCGDNSDEENCPQREITMEECSLDKRLFYCHDGVLCLELFQLCNGKEECLDGSDEGGRCNETGMCSNSSCPHDCYPSPNGPLCACPKGTFNDGHTCQDVNECEQFGICDHKCKNFKGGYQCYCDPGYQLQPDKRTCKAEGPEGLLLFSSHKQIRAYFLTSEVYYPVAKDLSQVTGVAYDGEHVYWTNVYQGEEAIMRAVEDGSQKEVVITAGLGTPEDLALDWVTKNIYFTDSKFQHLGVCSNEGTTCTVLHNRDIDKPRGICLSPLQGLMYWSDWGNRPLIARSGMDGSEVFDFVTKDLHWPNGLTIDHGNERLYWVDAKLLVIESIKLDGTDRRVVLSEAIKHPYAVAVFESNIYWSDWTGQEILRCNKFTGKDRHTVIREKNNRIFGVHIYHPAMMNTTVRNPCIDAGCSDLCLLAPKSQRRGYTCHCPQNKLLAPNNHACEQVLKSLSLVVGAGNTLMEVEHQHLGRLSATPLPLRDVYKIGAIAYNAFNGHIVIFDSADKKIVSLDRMSGETTVLLSSDLGKVEGMDVDPYGHNLYWADSERQTVEVFSLNTHERKVLLRDLGGESPVGITLVPDQGFMFVALMGPKVVHIDRFSMDGEQKTHVHIAENNVLGPNVALTYDKGLNYVFWSDSGTGHIEAVDVEGMKRIKIRELYNSPMDIAVVADDIFWTNHGSANLLWVNKYDDDADSSKQLKLDFTHGLESVRLAAVTGLVSGNDHPCQKNNGGCSHICLLKPNKQVCACPFGMVLTEDSRTCEMPKHCQVGQYRCTSGECISVALRCNHRVDCHSGDDELNCKTFTLQCTRGTFSCHNGEKCLDHEKRCDGTTDCQDGSDEVNCFTESSTCKPGEFQCKSGPCIPMSWRCDDTKDCEDESDELQCDKTTCHPEKEFRCTSGTCIPSSWECDGQPDCSDASDEHDICVTQSSCAPDQLVCNNGRCVDRQLICDGRDDCEDGTDETDCRGATALAEEEGQVPRHIDETTSPSQRLQCNDTEFVCDICLPSTARCNGTAECLRGEDETGCDGCLEHQFQCPETGRCIPQEWTCDRANDCGDNSDEDPSLCQHRGIANKALGHGISECLEFTCKNKKCLPFIKVCDGKADCEDGSDEGGRCGRGCADAGCMDKCQETPSGPKCACFHGYQLSGDSKSCTDVDECALGIYCSQFCHNTPGSFSCSCQYPDYQLRENRMTCKAKGHEMALVFATNNEIRYVTQTRSKLGVIHKSQTRNFQVSGLDVDSRRRCIYWSSATVGTITRSCNKNETSMTSLVRPGKLAVDWATENVYFVERDHIVKVCNFNVGKCSIVVKAAPEVTIDTLAVDPTKKLMFWTESMGLGEVKSVLKRADMSGAAVSIVLGEGLHRVTDIVLDPLHQLVYWLDADKREVERISYNGTNRQSLFASPDTPMKLALFEHYVMWLVEARSTVRRQHLDTYGNVWQCAVSGPTAWRCDVIRVDATAPAMFTVMQEANQELVQSECSSCSHLCVTGPTCLCANGTRVKPGQECPSMSVGSPVFITKVPADSSSPSLLWTLFKITLLTCIIIPIALALFVLRYDIMALLHSCISATINATSKPVFSNIHFNNPAYNVSASHLETVFHHSRLTPGEHQYENPITSDNISDGTQSTITNEINETKKPKVIEFHVTDFVDGDSASLEYSEAIGESHKTPLIR
ncbi:putative vitellogenin receptor [Macrosteles quadrilineatus]|uniref:putative vitellogenin receptor n=1 Tax=Macrosteles quadrilineatus TaxID=74068 RepID=UPI0023E218EB|nr:putative vitellogenin receptor [Macrosteles quadrilineatus]XP_054256860.1 putative vitellogenin receptor [Macrosteles quadrilineatus]